MGKKKSSSKIVDLPEDSDDEDVNPADLEVLNGILDVKNKSPQEYNNTWKYVFYATALFAALSLPFTDRILELAVPGAGSWLILWGIKIVAFFLLFYVAVRFSQT